MKLLNLFFLSLLLLVASCNQDKRPEGVLEEQKMVHVLADLHIIDGYMSSLMYTDSLRISGKNYYATVYKNHNISKSVYEKSLKYYSSQPVLLDSMYSRVEDILKAKEDSLNKITEAEQKKLIKINEAKQKKLKKVSEAQQKKLTKSK